MILYYSSLGVDGIEPMTFQHEVVCSTTKPPTINVGSKVNYLNEHSVSLREKPKTVSSIFISVKSK